MTKTSALVNEVQALQWLDVEAEVKFKLRWQQNRGGSLRGTEMLPEDPSVSWTGDGVNEAGVEWL